MSKRSKPAPGERPASRSPAPPVAKACWWKQDWFFGCVLLAITFLAYLPVWHAGFIWEDDLHVTGNSLLTAPDGLHQIWFSGYTRSQNFPLVYTTFFFEHLLWGFHPLGYHLVNVLLHGINAWLIWGTLRRLLVPGAWLAAAIFAVHPVQVETVAWVSELKNTESTLFYLLAVRAWMRFIDPKTVLSWPWYLLTLAFHALALFAKTTACTLPAAMVLVLWLQQRPIRWLRAVQIIPFVALALALGFVAIEWEKRLGDYALSFGTPLSWLDRLLLAARALWFYAGKLTWPANLTFSYPKWQIDSQEPVQYLWPAGWLAVVGLWWWQRKRLGRGPMAGLLFFAAALSPLIGFIWVYTFRFSYVADRYQYLACIGLIAPAASLATRWTIKWSELMRGAGVALILAVLGILTSRQCETCRDLETLWRSTLERNPDSGVAEYNLGLIIFQRGQMDEGVQHFQRAVELEPDLSGAWNNLGYAQFKKGQVDEAITNYFLAIKLDPRNSEAMSNLGQALLHQGHWPEGVAQFRAAFQLDPDNAAIDNNLAWVLATSPEAAVRNGPEAMAAALKANELTGNTNSSYLATLAAAYAEAGHFPDAIATARHAIETTTNPVLVNLLQEHVKLYQINQPLRYPAP